MNSLADRHQLAVRVATLVRDGVSQKKIADQLEVSSAKVSRFIKYAKQEGILEIKVNERPRSSPKRLHPLEDRLRRKFRVLREAIVVQPSDAVQGELEERRREDLLHQDLAKCAADYLRSIFRDGDHIGVGGGRGAFYTTRYLLDTYAPLPMTSIKITALAGGMATTSWTEEDEQDTENLDPDDVAQKLAMCFKNPTLVQLDLPCTYENAAQRLQEERGHWEPISYKRWEAVHREDPSHNTVIPNIALIGLGSLAVGHRFLDEGVFQLSVVETRLQELKKLIKDISGYFPIADLLNFLILADPAPRSPQGIPPPPSKLEKIQHLIQAINKDIMSVRPEQLSWVRDVIVAVAGGSFKLDSIWNILHQRLFEDRLCLSTDGDTALTLLRS